MTTGVTKGALAILLAIWLLASALFLLLGWFFAGSFGGLWDRQWYDWLFYFGPWLILIGLAARRLIVTR